MNSYWVLLVRKSFWPKCSYHASYRWLFLCFMLLILILIFTNIVFIAMLFSFSDLPLHGWTLSIILQCYAIFPSVGLLQFCAIMGNCFWKERYPQFRRTTPSFFSLEAQPYRLIHFSQNLKHILLCCLLHLQWCLNTLKNLANLRFRPIMKFV